MSFLANLLSGAAESASATPFTLFFFWDEPECPEELI